MIDPIEGEWYWVREAEGNWFVAKHQVLGETRWTNEDCWDDLHHKIVEWRLIQSPTDSAARDFLADLRALCVSHGVCLSVSDYDSLQIWPLEEGDDPIRSNGIVDKRAK